MNELKTKIKQMIVERLFLPVKPEEIKDNDDLMVAFSIDSVSLFELVVGLEDEFGIVMDDVDFQIETFRTVDSIAAFAQGKVS